MSRKLIPVEVIDPRKAQPVMPVLAIAADRRITEFGFALEALARLGRIIDRSLRDNAAISQAFFEALLRIERSGGSMTMGCLADQILITSGGVTRLVDRLADHGYAERRPCESDRRVQYVAITDAGRQVLERALEIHLGDLQREYFDRMSDHERTVLAEVLDRLRSPANDHS